LKIENSKIENYFSMFSSNSKSTHQSKTTGFTLIELLVVIVIITILATMATVMLSNARAKARDAKRISDIRQLSTALEMYYNDQGYYPTYITANTSLKSPDNLTTYLSLIPINPTSADGNCPVNTDYAYQTQSNNTSYTITFCLGNSSGAVSAGTNRMTPGGVLAGAGCLPACTNKACGDNGCGGVCGTCEVGDDCTANQCVPDSYTKLLLHFNNATNNYVDSSPSGKSAGGSLNGSNAVSKFGSYVADFNNYTSYIFYAGSGAYSNYYADTDLTPLTKTYTIDFWAYNTVWGSNGGIITTYVTYPPNIKDGWYITINNTNVILGDATGAILSWDSSSLNLAQWYHFAFVGDDTKAGLYIDGKLKAYTAANRALTGGYRLDIGRIESAKWIPEGYYSISVTTPGNSFRGYLDELRISKGVARWTCSDCTVGTQYFTPPTKEY